MEFKKIFKKLKQEINERLHGDEETWADYPGVGKITDRAVYEHMKKHTHWFDRLNPRLVCHYSLASQLHLMKVLEDPKDPNWKYPE